MLKLLVVGTLRCGTADTAQALNLMGFPCGHGWVFGHDEVQRYPELEVIADASLAAAPLARAFGGLVLHQVRDSLKVIGSLLSTGLIEYPRASGLEGVSITRQFPLTGNPIPDAMRYHVDGNAQCERGDRYFRLRVEDLDVGRLGQIAALI
jgi:hypothetical protein